jgi:hypothetical protein
MFKALFWFAAGGILTYLLFVYAGDLGIFNGNPQLSNSDPKIEQAYRRSGFGDILMNQTRRTTYGDCYKAYLASLEKEKLQSPTEGKLVFVFHLAEDGKLRGADLAIDDFQNAELRKCVEKGFKGIRFLPPPLGINRFFAHEFQFKKEETYQRELEEKKNRSPLELVVPTETPQK